MVRSGGRGGGNFRRARRGGEFVVGTTGAREMYCYDCIHVVVIITPSNILYILNRAGKRSEKNTNRMALGSKSSGLLARARQSGFDSRLVLGSGGR